VHVDPDGTANVNIGFGANAHVAFQVTRQQRAMILAQMRPAMPYAFASVSLLALGLLVIATTTPPMTG
jgi:hypothetical protein